MRDITLLVIFVLLTTVRGFDESASFPDLTPDFPLEDLPFALRAHIINTFAPAVYHRACDRVDEKPLIEPVYYWPGERVDLECRICDAAAAYNGKMKRWNVITREIRNKIDGITYPEHWKRLNKEYIDELNKQYDADYEGIPVNLPASPSVGKDAGGPIEFRTPKHPPKTGFFQRDGKLIITHPRMDSYGLYRCFDDDTLDQIKQAFLLVPIVPLYDNQRWNTNLGECEDDITREEKYITVTPRSEYKRFDEFHRAHFLPVLLMKTADELCTPDQDAAVCRNAGFAEDNQPPADHIADAYYDDPFATYKEIYNLKIFVKWSPWSTCTGSTGIRTRQGLCHIGKTDPTKKADKEAAGMSSFVLNEVHTIIEAVSAFAEDGFVLFSGILADIVLKETQRLSHCSRGDEYDFKVLEKDVLRHVRMAAKVNYTTPEELEVIQNACFREVKNQHDEHVTVGQVVIQNEKCPE